MSRESELISIKHGIDRNGYHITIVMQGVCPRFLYTIGLKDKIGYDFIIPGYSEIYSDDIITKINRILLLNESNIDLQNLEEPCTCPSDPSWIELMALGAIDFYGAVTPFTQIRPDASNWTIDTPDLSRAWSADTEPVWRWLKEPWPFPVPSTSTATTNLDALRGGRVTEAARWAEDDWELFAGSGPDTPEEDIRVMPLATLLGYDPSLSEIVSLEVGKAAWREANELSWHDWEAAS